MGTARRDWPSSEERLAALHDQLIAAVEALTSSPAWATMLRVAARFPDYSPSNVLLIAVQRPDATRVAGIRTWNSLGRRVLKGEHGIAILAPCVYRTRDHHAPAGVPAPTVGAGSEHRPMTPDADTAVTRRELRGFKVVHVFDLTQTEGDPLPDVAPELLRGTAPEHLWDHLAEILAADGYRLERGACRGANGWTDYATRTVRIRDDVDPVQAVKTLAHELGHVHADHEHRFPTYAHDHACRGRAEVEAESIAYLVTAQAGLDSTTYSVPYLAGWSDGDLNILRTTATTALTTARAIGDLLPLPTPPASELAVTSTPAPRSDPRAPDNSAGAVAGRDATPAHAPIPTLIRIESTQLPARPASDVRRPPP
ncbi:ArdC-like ssDNA-binding domain-containing protein [Cellulomonas fimi]|uniref:ImmA/IrrE family metallo-endopeptidase n=1 Tax=Cellulomonas fimi TaxID=1708 RepID=A0A7Y0LW03_CELFI|nr:ArdC-like ssDNA-binding domain-containing protein [Cellulomonas fimi]NMR19193.1 ImmA/IrrE family metallo-endopeptidase [Cellulomonas fimi]